MIEDPRVVFESRDRRSCADRALVLAARGIVYQVVDDPAGFALVVAADQSAAAAEELRLYDAENPPVAARRPLALDKHDPVPGVSAYLVVIVGVAVLAAHDMFSSDWRLAGGMNGALFRDGELWRAMTALTLHLDLAHIAGNIVFGALFGTFAGRYAGSGVAWLTILIAASLANAANALLLDPTHRSIGASTAVFASLGLATGFAFRARVFADGRWISRVAPIVAGSALLMYTGTGDDNTDIGAHLLGFVAGLSGGALLVGVRDQLGSATLQRRAGIVAMALLSGAWLIALSARAFS